MQAGNKPVDGGFLKIELEDYEDFIRLEPAAKKFIKRLIGSDEFINGKLRYCLWLVDATPAEIRKMKLVYGRVKACRDFRLTLKDTAARKLAETPTTFRDTLNPESFIVVPVVSSERRRYVPMGFLDKNFIPTNQVNVIPSAQIYHFGILTSSIHMGWMRTVCGRLKSDYRYSATIVYNNFIWANPTPAQKKLIEQTAQRILDVRSKYPDSTLADLYDELTMPRDLREAHRANDRAVAAIYGFEKILDDEPAIVSDLFQMYDALTKK